VSDDDEKKQNAAGATGNEPAVTYELRRAARALPVRARKSIEEHCSAFAVNHP